MTDGAAEGDRSGRARLTIVLLVIGLVATALFSLTSGASVQAKIADADGKEVTSDSFAVPEDGGARLLLCSRCDTRWPTAEDDRPLAFVAQIALAEGGGRLLGHEGHHLEQVVLDHVP